MTQRIKIFTSCDPDTLVEMVNKFLLPIGPDRIKAIQYQMTSYGRHSVMISYMVE